MTALSAGARRLYRQLLELGPVETDLAPVDGPDDERLTALTHLGLVYELDGEYIAIPAAASRARVMTHLARRSRDLLEQVAEVGAFLDGVIDEERKSSTEVGEAVEVVAGNRAVLLSATLQRGARREVLSVNTAVWRAESRRHHGIGPTDEDMRAGVRYRVLYARAILERGRHDPFGVPAVEGDEEQRVHPAPLLKFKVIDGETALVPLDETGAAGALVIRSRPLCALFVDYFERMWAESTPMDGSAPERPPLAPVQLRILQLLADDRSDPAIVQRLGISDRTLRRHLATIMERLGVTSRTGALGVAVRNGWLAGAAPYESGASEVAADAGQR